MESSLRSSAPLGARGRSAPAMLLHEGERHVLMNDSFTIGRLPDNDLTIASDAVSRQQVRIEAAQGGYRATDLGSRNGTLLNGERFRGESRWLSNGDTLVVGG